jgi:hypothetical protein
VLCDDAERNLRFYLLEDSPSRGEIDRVRTQARACIDLFARRFGTLAGDRRLAAIEIPDGMGGQAADEYFTQQTYAFVHPEAIDGIYHEIAHGWTTARPTGQAVGRRFFDESIASYLQVYALRELHGTAAAATRLERMRRLVAEGAAKIGDLRETTLALHGQDGNLAYNKGAWMLCALERIMGNCAFERGLRAFMHDYHDAEADFPQFISSMQAHAEQPLDGFFAYWLYGWRSTLDLIERSIGLPFLL